MAMVRHRDFGGPSWLWSALDRDFKLAERGIAPTVYDDSKINDRLKIYRAFHSMYRTPGASSERLSRGWPSLYNAAQMWGNDSPSSLKWIVEAMLMTEASYTKIASELGSQEKAATVRAYKEMFFDVEDEKDKPAWMQAYLWTPCRSAEPSLFYVNYMYKIVAFYGGPQALGKLFSAVITEKDKKTFLHDVMKTEMIKLALQFPANHAKLDVSSKSIMDEKAINSFGADQKLEAGPEDTDDDLKALADEMSTHLSVFDLDEQLGSKESVATSIMYTDEDINNGKNEPK